jgi:TPR repeat protein
MVVVAATFLLGCGSSSREFADVHKCDEFAAHPDDPGKWAEGVAEESLLPGPAVKLCTQAVEEHPGTARFHFQLGRALWAAGRIDEGVEVFLTAQEMEYAPAYAYLGDAYQEGLVPGEPADPEFAQQLYTLAAEGGFEPARAILEGGGAEFALGGGGGSGVSVVGQRGGRSLVLANPDFFKHPDWLAALHDGDFATLLQTEGINLYLEGLQEFMQPDNYRMIDPTCSAVADVRLSPRLAAIRMGVGLDSSNEDAMLGGGSLLLNMLNQSMTDPMGYARFQAELGYLMADGQRDMSTLVQQFQEEGGCVSPEVRTTYGNIARFLDYSSEAPGAQGGQTGFQDMIAPPGSQRIDLKADYEASQRRRAQERQQALARQSQSRSSPRADRDPPPRRAAGRGVTLFSDENYSGTSERFLEDDADLDDNRIGSDEVSSIRVDSGCSAVLFSRSSYRGRSRTVSSDTPTLRMNWKERVRKIHRAGDDSISSIKVDCG